MERLDDRTPARGATRDEDARVRSLTVLISDVVGSTDLRVRLGADGERLLRLHETLARDAVAAHDGTFVKGLGDGAMAVFEAAADAVAAAVRLMCQLDALHRRDEAGDLHLRIGVSAGDVAVGVDDCYGLPVAEAVRLCAAASTDGILVADVVRALGRAGIESPLVSAGALDLKGLAEPVLAWNVDWQPRVGGWAMVPLPPRMSAPSTGRFVGRVTELADLGRWSAEAVARQEQRLVVIAGETGMGKSALAAELGRRLHEQSSAVIAHGMCDEELRPPYQPFAQALRHLVRHAPVATLEAYVRRHGGDLGVLVPELAERLGRVPPPRTTAEAADRYLLFRAVAGLLDEVVSQVPLVLILDDLQWADRGTLLLLKHVLTSGELSGLVVVGTFRTEEPQSATDLAELIADLHRVTGVHRVDLDGLRDDDLQELAATLLDADPAQIAAVTRAVHRETDGNAFFAIEMLRHVGETHAGAGPSALDLPPSVREVVRQRVRRLGDESSRLLSCAAVLGAEFSLSSVADVADMHPDTALDLLDEAVAAAVLREVPGRSRFRFVHALTQHTLYDDLSSTRRRRLHRSAAEALERTVSSSAAAAHWLAAGDLADMMRGVAACTAAADEALLARAPDEAAGWYAAALDLLAEAKDGPVTCELLLRLGDAQRLAGDPAHRATLGRAARLARQLDDPERLARAALASTRWFSSSVGDADPEQVDMLEAALEAVGPAPSQTRARLLATLTAELVYTDRTAERFALIDEAVAVAREIGDPTTLFDVLFWRATAAREPLLTARDSAELAELTRLADGADPMRQALGDLVVVLRCLESGALPEADAALERATRLAAELRVPVLQWLVTVLQGTLATARGYLDDAEQIIALALEQSQATDQPDAATWFGVQLYMIRYEQGRLGELLDLLGGALANAPRLYTWHGALAMAYAETSRLEEAADLVRQLLEADYPGRPSEPHWLVGMVCLASAVARLGDQEAADRVYTALLPYAGHWASVMPLSLGAVDRVLGQLAFALDRLDDAQRHFATAIEINEAGGAPSFAARARVGLIRTLLVRDGADRDQIEALASEVREACARHGLDRVAAALDAVGLDVAFPSYPDLPAQAVDDVHGSSVQT